MMNNKNKLIKDQKMFNRIKMMISSSRNRKKINRNNTNLNNLKRKVIIKRLPLKKQQAKHKTINRIRNHPRKNKPLKRLQIKLNKSQNKNLHQMVQRQNHKTQKMKKRKISYQGNYFINI